MNIMDRISRLIGNGLQTIRGSRYERPARAEIDLIADGHVKHLAGVAASLHLHAVDPKHDTPLAPAPLPGDLAQCGPIIQVDSDPGAPDDESWTPANLAIAEDYGLAEPLPSSPAAEAPDTETAESHAEMTGLEAPADRIEASPEPPAEESPSADRNGCPDDLDGLLNFETEDEPEDFLVRSTSEAASGTFAAFVCPSPAVPTIETGDWALDLSPVQISGEGIGSGDAITLDRGGEHDFLKVRDRGRRSARLAVVQPGTSLAIDTEICRSWAEDVLAKGWFTFADMETLVASCEGNGDPEELCANLERNLEAAGLELVDQDFEHGADFWDARTDISPDELAEAIEAALTRATRLPGTQRFVMDKSNELHLLEPMVRAKQDLQLGMLASKAAVETILAMVGGLRSGLTDPGSVTLRPISPARRDHAETDEFFAAADELRAWYADGRVMDGKRRRNALEALESLDLSLTFYKETVEFLSGLTENEEAASRLRRQISAFETTTERLILEHLPYARRFAARSVEEGEDPEDVFQIAFTGLQRSTRRFDPERGIRFVIYCTFWMQQTLMRWRADERVAIRVPVHRRENLTKLDRAVETLGLGADDAVSDADLATELGWASSEVRKLREIPRQAEYPASIDEWDELFPEPEHVDQFDRAETRRIVADLLAELQERQADVVRMRFGIGSDEAMTLEEIGQLYGVTRERIRQIEAKGLKQLGHPARKRHLQALLGM